MKLNIVPARTGILWVKLGVQTFFRQPLAMAGLFFMYMAGVMLLTVIPVVGQIVGAMLVPAATLGLMAATAEATNGRFPMPTVLLSAFRAGRQRGRAMLVLGALYAAGSVLATALGSLITGPVPAAATADAQAQVDASVMVGLLLHTPLFILFWHAPALVHWHGVTPVKSLFFSGVACLRNLGAFLMYGATWVVLFMSSAFVLGTVGLMAGGVTLSKTLLAPLAVLMAAMFSTSIYFTFRDSFVAAAPEEIPHE